MKAYYYWEGSEEPKYLLSCKKSWIKHGLEVEKITLDYRDFLSVKYIDHFAKKKNWAYISDYLRYVWFKDHEGIYMDCDMFLCRDIPKEFYESDISVSCETSKQISNGIMKFTKNCSLIQELCKIYENYPEGFEKSSLKSPRVFMKAIKLDNFRIKKDEIKTFGNIKIFGREYCYPLGFYDRIPTFTDKTFAIHQWHASADNSKAFFDCIDNVYKKYDKEIKQFLKETDSEYFDRSL